MATPQLTTGEEIDEEKKKALWHLAGENTGNLYGKTVTPFNAVTTPTCSGSNIP